MKNPWSKPKHTKEVHLTDEEKQILIEKMKNVTPQVRIGKNEGMDKPVVGKVNFHLQTQECMKVEFVKYSPAEIKELVEELKQQTASICLHVHGNTALFFRKHPNKQ